MSDGPGVGDQLSNLEQCSPRSPLRSAESFPLSQAGRLHTFSDYVVQNDTAVPGMCCLRYPGSTVGMTFLSSRDE